MDGDNLQKVVQVVKTQAKDDLSVVETQQRWSGATTELEGR